MVQPFWPAVACCLPGAVQSQVEGLVILREKQIPCGLLMQFSLADRYMHAHSHSTRHAHIHTHTHTHTHTQQTLLRTDIYAYSHVYGSSFSTLVGQRLCDPGQNAQDCNALTIGLREGEREGERGRGTGGGTEKEGRAES